jgi:hypothetical protein
LRRGPEAVRVPRPPGSQSRSLWLPF